MTLILPLMFISCQKTPVAHFSTDTLEPEVGHDVLFNNDSQNAAKFEWDFGDGYISSEKNPSHVFTSNSKLDVTLTATSKSGTSDKASITLNVMIPTLLVVEVLEWNNEAVVVPDASILLYNSLEDWNSNKPELSVNEGFTDVNGIAVFANLNPSVYYIDVYEATHDNWDFGNPINGILYIRSPQVMSHQINWFVAWVDVVNHGTGQARGPRPLVIKKIERKSLHMYLPATGRTENWQDLYNRRVIKK